MERGFISGAVALALATAAHAGALSAADLTPRVVCSIAASLQYGIPANVLLAVAEQEGGKPGQWVRNKNGTYDIGPMQINTAYLRDLSRYGITAADVAANGCYPYRLAAWRIRGHILHGHGDFWTRVADYHSTDPRFNAPYRRAIIRRAAKWAVWFDQRFHTIDVAATTSGAAQ